MYLLRLFQTSGHSPFVASMLLFAIITAAIALPVPTATTTPSNGVIRSSSQVPGKVVKPQAPQRQQSNSEALKNAVDHAMTNPESSTVNVIGNGVSATTSTSVSKSTYYQAQAFEIVVVVTHQRKSKDVVQEQLEPTDHWTLVVVPAPKSRIDGSKTKFLGYRTRMESPSNWRPGILSNRPTHLNGVTVVLNSKFQYHVVVGEAVMSHPTRIQVLNEVDTAVLQHRSHELPNLLSTYQYLMLLEDSLNKHKEGNQPYRVSKFTSYLERYTNIYKPMLEMKGTASGLEVMRSMRWEWDLYNDLKMEKYTVRDMLNSKNEKVFQDKDSKDRQSVAHDSPSPPPLDSLFSQQLETHPLSLSKQLDYENQDNKNKLFYLGFFRQWASATLGATRDIALGARPIDPSEIWMWGFCPEHSTSLINAYRTEFSNNQWQAVTRVNVPTLNGARIGCDSPFFRIGSAIMTKETKATVLGRVNKRISEQAYDKLPNTLSQYHSLTIAVEELKSNSKVVEVDELSLEEWKADYLDEMLSKWGSGAGFVIENESEREEYRKLQKIREVEKTHGK
ncbi:hypothetical protein C8R42DRAFT_268503 [Lentinula raphanica]|nr:hypothetical protein C8R42DRAFT_268503 [Lentinula raphanica]